MALSSSDFDFIRRLVRERSAIVLEPGKEYLVELRLKPLLRLHHLESMESLVGRLRQDRGGQLTRQVVEAMTTNETSFFRDVHPFETLRRHVLPEAMTARGRERSLNIWCAACSSGQEVYSVAMTLKEHFPELSGWNVRILASDLSSLMVNRAREGRYSQLEINRGLPAQLLVKYFDRVEMDWQVKAPLRRLVDFREFNLAVPWPPLPAMDIVFMRNVLIYFDEATKRAILGRLHQAIRPQGWLFLGGSETTLNLDARFEQVRLDRTLCYRARS